MAIRAKTLKAVEFRPRQSAQKRGYDKAWQKLRRLKLKLNPTCEDCDDIDKVTEAKDVHHIEPIRDRPDLRLDIDNLKSLCKRCHAIRTARGE